ncbi:MAG: Bcr/CflA family drug resistance efflux transporter, partial [Tardiphaga sp.]|nr:Bcr/CflA family drug resistance efflux transporter [Tardiphaga sp.]
GGIMIAIAGLFFDGTSLPMVATITLTAVGAFIVAVATLRSRELAPAAAE